MELSEYAQSKHGSGRHPIEHWGVVLAVIHTLFPHASMGSYVVFVFDEPPIWILLSLEGTYIHDGILTI